MAETGEADFPGAIWGAFKDLTMNTIKKIASELFKTWMKSDAFKKVAGNTIAEAIINFFKDTIQGFGTSEITQKLLDEAFGAGLTKLVENLENGDLTFKPADGQGGDFYFTFVLCKKSNGKNVYCELNLNAILEYHSGSFSRLFEAVYSKLFGTFSGAPAPVTFPDDPPPISKEELTANKEKLEASINKQNEIFERFLDKVEEASKNTVL